MYFFAPKQLDLFDVAEHVPVYRAEKEQQQPTELARYLFETFKAGEQVQFSRNDASELVEGCIGYMDFMTGKIAIWTDTSDVPILVHHSQVVAKKKSM